MARPAAAQKPFLATTPGLVLGCTFACLLWGSAFPCIKIGYGLFGIASTDVASIIAFAGARFLISGAPRQAARVCRGQTPHGLLGGKEQN